MSVMLRPCPFCGSEKIKVAPIRDGCRCHCAGCHAAGAPEYHGPLEIPTAASRAISAWNHRHGDEDDNLPRAILKDIGGNHADS